MNRILVLAILSISGFAYGQQYYTIKTAPESLVLRYQRAVQQLLGEGDAKGLAIIKSLTTNSPVLLDALIFLGEYYSSREETTSISYYQKAVAFDPYYSVENLLVLVELEKSQGQYEQALKHVNLYLSKPNLPGQKRASKLKTDLDFKVYLIQHPVEFDPINLGPRVNTHNHEYHPYIRGFNEELVLTTDTFLPRDSLHFNRFGNVNEDIKSFKRIGSDWIPQFVWSSFNTKKNEGAVTLSGNGEWLTYTQCNVKPDKGDCDLYFCEKQSEGWGAHQSFGDSINTDEWESQPCFSFDGTVLVFVRDHMSQTDIWMSKKQANGSWEVPELLPFNTGGNEHSPFLHPDGRTMYFISDHYPGMGGDDIFITHLDTTGKWSEPINMGYPINTHMDELGISISQDGKTAYFTTNRKGGFGGMDVYSFELPSHARPQLIHLVTRVVDQSGQLVEKAQLQIQNQTTRQSQRIELQEGKIEFTLPKGSYQISLNKSGYFTTEKFLIEEDSNSYKSYEWNVTLHNLNSGNAMVLKNVHFVQSKDELLEESFIELELLLEWLLLNPTIKIKITGHTDNVGDAKSNFELSEKRAIKVKEWLIQRGISFKRLRSQGFGSSRPLVSNDTEEHRKLNRRVEFELLP